MPESNSLINLGELSKPATVLVEKIAEAVGGVFRPYQIRRVARAEADAEVIRTKTQIEVTDLHRRAFQRFLDEEAKKQQNIEDITKEALPLLNAGSRPETVEDDWLVHFFDKSRLVSDKDMQLLWSRVLAGEANQAGSYSKRTLNFLSSLDKADAELYREFCTFCVHFGKVTPLIFSLDDSIYKRRGITFNAVMHLQGIGLLQFEALAGFERTDLPKKLTMYYHGTPLELVMPQEEGNRLPIGQAILTRTGEQLAPICGSAADSEFLEYVRARWRSFLPQEPAPG